MGNEIREEDKEEIVIENPSVKSMIYHNRVNLNKLASSLKVVIRIGVAELTITGVSLERLASAKIEVEKFVQDIMMNHYSMVIENKDQCEVLAK